MSNYNWDTTAEQVASDCRPSIMNKTILITGVTPGGLGAGFATIIAPYNPSLIILAARDTSKAKITAQEIENVARSVATRILELDLNSQTQIRKAAKEVLSYDEHIDVLVNNAGVMAPPFRLTEDGVESQFGINHVGHFLFTNLIMSKLIAPGKVSRVVNVSSDGHRMGPVRFDDWNFDDGNTYDPWLGYGQAKTANMLFSLSLAQKLGTRGLISVSLHPGVINTNLLKGDVDESVESLVKWDKALGNRPFWRGFKWKTMSQGVATHVFAAFHDDILTTARNGGFLLDSTGVPPEDIRCWARDSIEAERLWKLSERIVGERFGY
ncbi:short-chain dehydrogenase [Aspergillus steynii IBT 23096]|uniref:Short-chain dehydrogenase n=1 Tax=Aspergillus steynii IBT 23096 TaxID=1392250 RepID=A0A2I2G440_9EURO|nr:short-chain dehydrogenase [Aspergillus steynii IBT 23096]PLB47638.1 short-chain dehydrogenase [Aspergillus steynii IBT 23096]